MRKIAHWLFGVFVMLLPAANGWAELVVKDATVRMLPPGVPNTAAYLVISNTGERDTVLIGGEASFAEKLELHNHVMHDGMMRMTQLEEVTVPAGESVTFAPGGMHLMLFGLKTALEEDAKVQLSLYTKQQETITFDAQVVMPGNERAASEHHHHHH